MAEAGIILEYRRALEVLGRAVDLAKVGAPIALIGPGPHWRPRRASDGDVVAPYWCLGHCPIADDPMRLS